MVSFTLRPGSIAMHKRPVAEPDPDWLADHLPELLKAGSLWLATKNPEAFERLIDKSLVIYAHAAVHQHGPTETIRRLDQIIEEIKLMH